MARVDEILNTVSIQWGKPQRLIENTASTGISIVDEAIVGVRLRSGGAWSIQGYEGSRKTTLLLNIIKNQFMSGRLPEDYLINYDMLESGQSIETVVEILIAMIATEIVVRWHWLGYTDDLKDLYARKFNPMSPAQMFGEVSSTENGLSRREATIRPEFLRGGSWTSRQKEAIEWARSIVSGFNLEISGYSENEDEEVARTLTTNTRDLAQSLDRWHQMSEEKGMQQLVIDNVPQYTFSDTDNAYEKAVRVCKAGVNWLQKYKGLVWIINQIPIGQRSSNLVELPSQYGGARILEESRIGWHVKYNPRQDPYHILMAIKKTRIGFHPDILVPVEPVSGAIIGEPKEA